MKNELLWIERTYSYSEEDVQEVSQDHRLTSHSIPRAEYMKMSDKSTAKAMFASLCANFEGSKKVREAKALMLVH